MYGPFLNMFCASKHDHLQQYLMGHDFFCYDKPVKLRNIWAFTVGIMGNICAAFSTDQQSGRPLEPWWEVNSLPAEKNEVIYFRVMELNFTYIQY